MTFAIFGLLTDEAGRTFTAEAVVHVDASAAVDTRRRQAFVDRSLAVLTNPTWQAHKPCYMTYM